MNTKLLRRIAISLGLIALTLWLADPVAVVTALRRADPRWIIAALTASTSAVFCGALRWRQLSLWLGFTAPVSLFLKAQWRGMAANTVLPGAVIGGDTFRALHLQRAGARLGTAASSVALDRLSGLWVLVIISLGLSTLAIAGNLLPRTALPLPWPVLALAATAALLLPPCLWRLSVGTRHLLPEKLATLFASLHARPHPWRQYGIQLLGSGLVQTCFILAFGCGGRAVGLDLPLWLFFIAAGPVFILAALPVSVGGWGTREAAAAVTLGIFGAPRELAVATSILYGLFAVTQGIFGALTLLIPNDTPPSISGENDA
ncbi:MAG: flippase-like domain-containing protein [Proteobacteria bacterium]|nr:flippase-like domain-containing protein [Pseudomonadota bacterium]HQR03262.1 lysylphosphatidylglycerol synthase transmembrane domain-containing protein [Rhodocyclaceae bacterium]